MKPKKNKNYLTTERERENGYGQVVVVLEDWFFGVLALARLLCVSCHPRRTGERNKTEAAYEQQLEFLRRGGEVLWYKFEGIKLRLADNTFLTVDFPVMLKDGALEMLRDGDGDRRGVRWRPVPELP